MELYAWFLRGVLGPAMARTRGRWLGLVVLSILALGTELGALVATMLLFGALFEPELGTLAAWDLSIPRLMLLLLFLYVVRGALNWVVQTGRRDLARQWSLGVAADLTRKILAMPLAAHRRWDLGTLMSLVAWSATGLAEAVEAAVIALPMSALSVAAILGFLSFYRPVLALILAAVFMLYAIPYFQLKDRAEALAAQRQDVANSLFEALSQVVIGMREVKTFRAVAGWTERLGKGYQALDATGAEESRLNETDQQSQLFLFNALGTLVILTAVLFFLAPALPDPADRMALTGQVFVFVLAQGLLAEPLTALMMAARSWRTAGPQLENLRRIQAEPEEAVDDAAPPAVTPGFGTLEFRGVTVRHDGTPVLQEASAVVREGSLVALVGLTGAGKSTFLDLLPRFVEPEPGGAVLLGGRDLASFELGALRAGICGVSQKPVLFAGSLRHNLTLGARRDVTDDELRAALALAQIDLSDRRFAARGLDAEVSRFGENFSGGEAQRVALARALVADPPVLLLDEATGSLDSLTEARFFQDLARRRGSRTVLAITHRLCALTPLADQVLVFQDGRIVQAGTHDDLVAAPGLYAELWESQVAAVREDLRSLAQLTGG